MTRTHDRLGTPLFMAPEQIRQGASTVDLRADVWALGVMLYKLLTGQFPFDESLFDDEVELIFCLRI